LRTSGVPQGGLVPYVTTVKTKSGATPARLSTDLGADDLGGFKTHVAIADPPDPEGSLRISAAVTGKLPDEALSFVFAVRPDDDVPAARTDPPSLLGKMPGQRHHVAV